MNLDQIRKIACALFETTEAPHFHFTSFRVRGKILATAPPDGEFLHLFVDDATREHALALYPDHMEKLLWGNKVVGLKVALRSASAAVVKGLLLEAWKNKAPKSLVASTS